PLRRSRKRCLVRARAACSRTLPPRRYAVPALPGARPPPRPDRSRTPAARRRLPPPRRGPPDRSRRLPHPAPRPPPPPPPPRLGALLAPALDAGRLRCVNACGTALADDKLAHAYVEEMVRFYLGEEPRLRSVPSYDLSDPAARTEAMGRLDELVVKPRDGFG